MPLWQMAFASVAFTVHLLVPWLSPPSFYGFAFSTSCLLGVLTSFCRLTHSSSCGIRELSVFLRIGHTLLVCIIVVTSMVGQRLPCTESTATYVAYYVSFGLFAMQAHLTFIYGLVLIATLFAYECTTSAMPAKSADHLYFALPAASCASIHNIIISCI